MKHNKEILIGLTLIMAVISGSALASNDDKKAQVERGRYLVVIGGCNDCHTPSYPEHSGQVPHIDWLIGNPVGFQGPWGTTYPANLRLVMSELSEQQWLEHARKPRRPPMPWFNLRDMSNADLLAIYAFIRDLGPIGDKAPAFVPPGEKATTPYIEFMPKNLPIQQAAR